jgi:5'-deoxynucleotidase YfbR-like HD superfamily hydrolase
MLRRQIHIEDITHALSQRCRYAGHTPGFYSVAQHLVLCSDQALKLCPDLALTALMHDASEAYLSDLPARRNRWAVHRQLCDNRRLAYGTVPECL